MTKKYKTYKTYFLLILVTLVMNSLISQANAELIFPSNDRQPNLSLDPFERARAALRKLPQNNNAPAFQSTTTLKTVDNNEDSGNSKIHNNGVATGSSSEEAENGVSYEIFAIVDALSITSGGESEPEADELEQKKTDIFGVAGIEMEYETSEAESWENGMFLVYAAMSYGAAPAVGDMHGISGIYAEGNTFRIMEAWYQHSFPESNSSVLIGLHNFIEEFYISEFGYLFVNNSFEVPRIVGVNANPSRFPLPSLGIRFKTQLSKRAYVQMAMYNATPDEEAYEKAFKKVIEVKLPSNDEILVATEFGMINGNPGVEGYFKASVGLWYLRQDQEGYLDYNESPVFDESKPGNAGVYLLAETSVSDNLGIFFKHGRGRSAVSRYSQFYSVGLNYTGIIASREDDIFGVGLVHTRQSAAFLDAYNGSVPENSPEKRLFIAETAIEITYSMDLNDWLTVQPDIQYIRQPSMKVNRPNTTVVGVRLIAEY